MIISRFMRLSATVILFCNLTTVAWADWQLNAERSHLSFGSVKKNTAGEVHHFQQLSGYVMDSGQFSLTIPLQSIETWVDIRNERMLEHLFQAKNFPAADINGKIDISDLQNMAPLEQRMIDARLTLKLAGVERQLDTELIVLRLSATDVLILPHEMIMLDAEQYGLVPGINKLAQLAGLSSISTAVPVSFYLTFTRQ